METFNFVPAYEHEESQGFRVLVSTFETGTEQRRIKRREPREWDLGFVGTIAFSWIRYYYGGSNSVSPYNNYALHPSHISLAMCTL